jgi:hypothetical protein
MRLYRLCSVFDDDNQFYQINQSTQQKNAQRI